MKRPNKSDYLKNNVYSQAAINNAMARYYSALEAYADSFDRIPVTERLPASTDSENSSPSSEIPYL